MPAPLRALPPVHPLLALIALLLSRAAVGENRGWCKRVGPAGAQLAGARDRGLPALQLVLRGGGPRKSAALRDQRRREVLADEWRRQGLNKIDPKSSRSKGDTQREGTVQAVRAARQKEESFEEFSARQQMPAWKLAELRRRSQEEHPEARWGKKWREMLGLPDPREVAKTQDDEDSDLPEGWPKLRKVNDHKGNIDHPQISDIPEHLTDVNDRNQWFEENMVFWNREVEYEDLGGWILPPLKL
jgi:hypothetical protein